MRKYHYLQCVSAICFAAVFTVKVGVECEKPIIKLRIPGGLSGTRLGCLWDPICPETPPGRSLGPPWDPLGALLGPPWDLNIPLFQYSIYLIPLDFSRFPLVRSFATERPRTL